MLAYFFEQHRQELLQRVESRAAAEEEDASALARRARIGVAVEELIEALRQGKADLTVRRRSSASDAPLEARERELVRLDVVEQVDRHATEATPDEMAIVSDWLRAANRGPLPNVEHWLAELLDLSDSGAAIVAPDGRLLYVNRTLASNLHDRAGVPMGAIVGRTLAELVASTEHGFPPARSRRSRSWGATSTSPSSHKPGWSSCRS
jgi:hypothetical protein